MSDLLKDYLDLRFAAFKEQIMSILTGKLAELNTSFDAALARVQEDVDALNAEVADLKVKVADGTATPDELAALDTLRGRIDALDPTKPVVLPEPGTEPAPAPAPPAEPPAPPTE